MQKKSAIEAIMTELQNTAYSDVQSIDALLEYGFKVQQWIAFSGEAQAEAKEYLHEARRKAYLSVEASLNAQGKRITPMIIKDYINDKCSAENGYYELCNRCNALARGGR